MSPAHPAQPGADRPPQGWMLRSGPGLVPGLVSGGPDGSPGVQEMS